jgi:arylsulfatase
LNPSVAILPPSVNQTESTSATAKPPYNIIFIIVDQQTYRLLSASGYSLPALEAIASHGVTFQNHYIASAMCSPSRATFLTGRPPQFHHVIDQMQYDYTPTLDPHIPNVGSVLKGLGYKTAYFGKFEMDKEIPNAKPTVNYTNAAQTFGFDVFSPGGDTNSDPLSGFDNDAFIAGEAVRWLRVNAPERRRTGQPFFMVASFVNPHDIMFGDGNIPGQPIVQKPLAPEATLPPACRAPYRNTRKDGTAGRVRSPQIARTCGPFSTTTT